MDRTPPEGQRKTVVILSERSREIIRLFEERQRKHQEAERETSLTPSQAESWARAFQSKLIP